MLLHACHNKIVCYYCVTFANNANNDMLIKGAFFIVYKLFTKSKKTHNFTNKNKVCLFTLEYL